MIEFPPIPSWTRSIRSSSTFPSSPPHLPHRSPTPHPPTHPHHPPAALDGLVHYAFPGNVRELRNLIERAYILSGEGDLTPDAFPSTRSAGAAPAQGVDTIPEGMDLRRALESVERRLLVKALEVANGVQAEAARRLGISRSDMAYKLKKFGLESGRR